MQIKELSDENLAIWVELRKQLWPHYSKNAHQVDGKKIISSNYLVSFIALDEQGNGFSFADTSIRHDYVNGYDNSPVAFLEGLFVTPSYRKKGIARLLVDEVQSWGLKKGCTELASDTALDHVISQTGLGFKITEKVVFFRKK